MTFALTVFSLFLNLFNPFISKLTPSETEEELISEETISNYKIIEYFTKEKDGVVDIYYINKYICSTKIDEYLIFDNYIITFSLSDNKSILKKYDNNGKKEEIEIKYNNLYIDYSQKINLLKTDNNYLLLIIELNSDIYIYKIDINNYKVIDKKQLIGSGVEHIEKTLFFNKTLYIASSKDNLSSGDYGNGGIINKRNITLLSIDENLCINNIKSFDSEKIVNLEVKDAAYLGITLNDSYYLYDSDLNQKMGLKFASDCIFGKTMINEEGIIYLTRFLKNGLEVYDLLTEKIVYQEGYFSDKSIHNITKIIERNDKYYLLNIDANDNKYIIDGYVSVYYIKDFIESNIYFSNEDKPVNINKYVYSLNKQINRSSFKTIGEFDSNKVGSFITYYFYDEIELINKTINYPFLNVKDGLIYNIGYILESNMEMFVNDELVPNNYELDRDGDYNIKYYNSGTLEKSVNIKVVNNKNNKETSRYYLVDYDYYLSDKENVRLEYNIDIFDDEEVEGIIINKELVKDYDVFDINENKKGIFVYLLTNKEGSNKINVSLIKIHNKDNDTYRFIEINKDYLLYRISDEINYDINFNIGRDIIVNSEVDDSNNILRGIYIDYYKDKNLFERVIYDIDNKKIELNDNDKYSMCNNIEIGYISDIGYSSLVNNELMKVKYNEISKNDYIDINVISKERSINSIELILRKSNNVISVSSGEEYVYKGKVYDYKLIVSISLLILFSSIIYCFIYLKKLNKKTKK